MMNKLFKESQRIDGRNIQEYRNIFIKFPKNKNGGSCLVSFGDTTVLAKVSCSVVEPKSTHPNRGLMKFRMDTSSLKSNTNKLRNSTDEILKLEPIIKDLLRDSIEMDSLCICAGEKVFCINIDITAEYDDGNLLDVIVLATTIALTTFKRPDVSIGEVVGGEAYAENSGDRDPVPLKLKQLPIFVTVGVAIDINMIIIDLGKVEEEVLDSRLVMAMTTGGELCCMWPLGSRLWTYDDFLDRCISLVAKKVEALQCLVSQAVAARETAGDGSVEINSSSFLQTHPVFLPGDNSKLAEVPKMVYEAPEVIELVDSDDMEIGSEDGRDDGEDDGQNDWSRIESLMNYTEKM